MRTTIIYTTGAPGAGKSYSRCPHYLLKEFLQNRSGQHISNFPVELEPWRDHDGTERAGLLAIGEQRGFDPSEIAARVVTFPAEVVESWRNADLGKNQSIRGPWDVLDDVDLSGCHIAIDEIHNFCGRYAARSVQQRWEAWLGEIRHQGATVEFLTQHDAKVAPCIKQHAEVRYELLKGETRRDFWFAIPMYDWYQLLAKCTGKYNPACWRIEYRQVKGKFTETNAEQFRYDAELFDCYRSHSAPVAGGLAGSEEEYEWQRFGWGRLLAWFLARNGHRLFLKGGFLVVLVLAVIFRGPVMSAYMWFFTNWIGQHAGPKDKPPKAVVQQETPAGGISSGPKPADSPLPEEEVIPTQDLRDATPALISSHSVTFLSGQTYGVGDTIKFGPLAGKQVKTVDFAKRWVLLNDGVLLRLGVSSLFDKDGRRDARIPERVPPARRVGENTGGQIRTKPVGDGVSPGNDASRIR